MTPADIDRIKRNITRTLQSHAGISPARTSSLLPTKSLQGKLYEAYILSTICEKLVTKEGCSISLVGGSVLTLRQKGGQINRSYSYFKVWKGDTLFGELFTDIYFTTLSYQMRGAPANITFGDYHELDITLLKPNQTGYPNHLSVMLAVECKNTSIKKSIIRELLGFRRELSLLQNPSPTNFSIWPTSTTPSDPNSVHVLYCSDDRIRRYIDNCLQFGIILEHERM